ncbi:cupin domain-containing protein [Rudanella paleaurantiibacter]|uniref:Cupin domain-containing protein n=1 Tax=Rudanella paleaurantiibacter TaxID=2614655 RepID=A0A7J5U2D4_9BACT|nr:cupin domain-containing protein [Rudanella paleaurantiibacter]KAB7731841.1 cupin domain-containing protein [Rudanella paleaurantiibacter]
MATANQILDLTPLGMLFTVLQTRADTNGKSLDLHWELLPGCNMKDPLLHIHPNAIETYEVLKGEMEFFVKDKWVVAREGDKLMVPAGVSHTFRNPTNQTVTVLNAHQPALRMEEYFEDVSKVLDKVTNNRQTEFSMNPKTMLYMGVLMNRYRNDIIARNPPDAAVRVLGFVGNLIGLNY